MKKRNIVLRTPAMIRMWNAVNEMMAALKDINQPARHPKTDAGYAWDSESV